MQYSKGTEDIVYITTSDNQSLLQFHINHLTREVDNPRTIPRHGEYQKFGRLYGQGHMYCEAGKVFKCMDAFLQIVTKCHKEFIIRLYGYYESEYKE